MKTGKVEYAPDYKSGRRTLTIAADIPDDVDDRLLFCDSTQERIAEHQRLQSAVVEAAKRWNGARHLLATPHKDANEYHERYIALTNSCVNLGEDLDDLIAFEAEHKIGE
jgi:23S rRNA A2030 N6-methylase RlmJ